MEGCEWLSRNVDPELADWKIKMEDLLIVKDLYELVDREQIPIGMLESKWKAMATIRQCVDVVTDE